MNLQQVLQDACLMQNICYDFEPSYTDFVAKVKLDF